MWRASTSPCARRCAGGGGGSDARVGNAGALAAAGYDTRRDRAATAGVGGASPPLNEHPPPVFLRVAWGIPKQQGEIGSGDWGIAPTISLTPGFTTRPRLPHGTPFLSQHCHTPTLGVWYPAAQPHLALLHVDFLQAETARDAAAAADTAAAGAEYHVRRCRAPQGGPHGAGACWRHDPDRARRAWRLQWWLRRPRWFLASGAVTHGPHAGRPQENRD